MVTFRAMNTDVEVLDAPAPRVQRLFEEWHRRLTRFDAASELSALNRSSGVWFDASPVLYDVVTQALRWKGETSGLFDPTIIDGA